MHVEAMAFVRSVLEQTIIPRGPIIEIGGRDINGTVRPLFDGIGPYASIDLYDGKGVDLVDDVCALDPKRTAKALFGQSSVTCVVCCEVLEHATDPKGICKWAYRVLGPEGVFIVTAAAPDRAAHSGIDGGNLRDGEHYRGVSVLELRRWLKDFGDRLVTLARDDLDIYAFAWKGRRPQGRP